MSKRSSLWIPTKLSQQQAAIVLACLSEVRINDAMNEQRELFVSLSKAFERRWPEEYQRMTEGGVVPTWREYWLDTMTEEEKRQAALASIDSPAKTTRDPDGRDDHPPR